MSELSFDEIIATDQKNLDKNAHPYQINQMLRMPANQHSGIKRPIPKQIGRNAQNALTKKNIVLNPKIFQNSEMTNIKPNISSSSKLYSHVSTIKQNKISYDQIYKEKLPNEESYDQYYDYEYEKFTDESSFSDKLISNQQAIDNTKNITSNSLTFHEHHFKNEKQIALQTDICLSTPINYSMEEHASTSANNSNLTYFPELQYNNTKITNNANDSCNNNIAIFNNNQKDTVPPTSKEICLINAVKYQMTRSTNISIHGKTVHFQLCKNGNPVLHSKVKSVKSDGLCYVGKGIDLHWKQNKYVGAILYANKCSTFSIRKDNEYGEEIMKILYRSSNLADSPRLIDIEFPVAYKNLPKKLQNKKAILNEDDQWVFNMKGNFKIKSIKNCVITDEKNNNFASVMKVDKKTLDIKAYDDFSDLMIFAIGLSSFFCKL